MREEDTNVERETRDSSSLIVCGIGASAGGLEALRRLLPGLPAETNLAYIIVQHLDPKHRSLLVNLLAPHSQMDVLAVANGDQVEAGKVYITPSGHDLVLKDGRMVLRESGTAIGPKPSVDMLLTSLAEEYGENAIGIILSGTGTDGAHGMRAVKGGGGITIVQTPAQAKYDGMPRAAQETGIVDLVLAAEDIGPELGSIISSPLMAPGKPPVEAEPDVMGRIFALIQRKTGCDFSDYKQATIQRRISRRLALHKLSGLSAYLEYVEQHPEDLEALTKDILISVTSFFRDEDAFAALAKLLPKMLKDKNAGDSVRVWVPGCSTGEEAYSLAMLFAEELGDRFESFNLQIFGTDIDAEAIAQARRGVYPETSLVDVDPVLLERHFRRQDRYLQVSKSLRERIVFAKQDLIRDPPFSRLDLITCRNLLIYLNADLQRRIIPMFHYALRPGGYLFLGKSESIGPHSDLFSAINKRWRIFQRRGSLRLAPGYFGHRAQPSVEPKERPQPPKPSLRQVACQAVADTVGMPGVLVNDRQEVVHVLGDVKPFLHLAEGDAGLNVIDLANDQIRVHLRAALHKATREKTPVTSRRIGWHPAAGSQGHLNLFLRPVRHEEGSQDLALIMFQVVETPELEPTDEDHVPDHRDQRIMDLEQELAANREHLQTTTEELETANEELQSLNEELQSSNEELQSSNEELETSNEELQATNEELTTVNDELQAKSAELAAANTDLENILARMGMPLIAVDEELRIRRFTPQSTGLFDLVAGQRGEVLTNVGTQVEVPNLGMRIKQVIASGESMSTQAQSGNRLYEMKAFPYVNDKGDIKGAIITFYDQTELKRREQEFRALADNAPDIVARFDKKLRHLYVNQAVLKPTGQPPEHFLGKTNEELGMPSDLCLLWDRALRQVFATGQENKVRFPYPSPDGEIFIETRMVPEFKVSGEVGTVLAVGRDVTPMVRAEKESKQAAERLADILGSISDGFFSLDDDLVVTYFNQAAGELLGRKPSEVVGRRLFDAFPEAKGSVFEEHYREALASQEPDEFEVHFDREPYVNWYAVRCFPFEEGLSVYFRVVTRRKEFEEETLRLELQLRHAQKMEAVGTLAGGIAHDFNNILAAIMGYAEIAMDDIKRDRVRVEDIERIVTAVNRASELIRNILAFSRKTGAELKALDANQQVRQAVDILKRTIPRMIALDVHLTDETAVIKGDPGQVQQVVLNLVSNARDAMPEGGRIRISTSVEDLTDAFCLQHPQVHPGRHLHLQVVDDGPGISPDVLEKVFDPFFTTKEVGSGTGLGLATVYGIVQRHGGCTLCRSDKGDGSTFDVYFPLTDEQPASGEAEGDDVLEDVDGDETVLVVDDELALRGMAQRMLARHGYKPITASSGEQAVELMRQRGDEIAAAILDIGMPGMGGHQCLRELLKIKPDLKIIVASGYARDEQMEGTLAAGAAGYTAKPYRRHHMLQTLRKLLDGNEAGE